MFTHTFMEAVFDSKINHLKTLMKKCLSERKVQTAQAKTNFRSWFSAVFVVMVTMIVIVIIMVMMCITVNGVVGLT